MQITCPSCSKKFEIQDNLIPQNGRLLQCGSCEHQWFYKINLISTEKAKVSSTTYENIIEEPVNKLNQIKKKEKIKKPFKKNLEISPRQIEKNKLKNKKIEIKKKNYFKLIIVILITFIACIILIDTFKNQLSFFYPNLINILNNLYEILKDIILFLNDLIK